MAYIVVSWVILQFADIVAPMMNIPDWAPRTVLFFLIIGFPIALFFSWVYELTPDGLKLEKDVESVNSITSGTGRTIDFIIIGALVLAVSGLIYERQTSGPASFEVSTREASIAVLPFTDMSATGDQQYFGDGISEEILNVLAKMPGLKVAGRTSSFQFKGQNPDLRKVGEILGVAHVLEGSIRKAGDKIRVTVQLIEAVDGFHLWSETYDRDLIDIFAIQDEISRTVAEALRVELGESTGKLVGVGTINIDAYGLYLRGRSMLAARGGANLNNALHLLNAATVLDVNFADAYAAKALIYSVINNFDHNWTRTMVNKLGEEAIVKALAINPNHGEAYMAQGMMQFFVNYKWREALESLNKANELMPNAVSLHNFYGDYYSFTMNLDKSLYHELEAIKLDPLSSVHIFDLANTYLSRGEFEKASEAFESAKYFAGVPEYYTFMLAEEGRFDEVNNYLDDLETRNIFPNDKLKGLRVLADMINNKDQSFDQLPEAVKKAVDNYHIQNVFVGRVYLMRGEVDQAVEYYKRAFEDGDSYLSHISFSKSRDAYPDNVAWQSLWDIPEMKVLEEIRAENALAREQEKSGN
jgi:TolB-like protein/tetratricopeptide (TPR) repeat protein